MKLKQSAFKILICSISMCIATSSYSAQSEESKARHANPDPVFGMKDCEDKGKKYCTDTAFICPGYPLPKVKTKKGTFYTEEDRTQVRNWCIAFCTKPHDPTYKPQVRKALDGCFTEEYLKNLAKILMEKKK